MYRKIALVCAAAIAIVGVGTAALATAGSQTTTGNGKSHAAAKHNRHALLRHVLHGQLTTRGKAGYVTHSGIRGTVTAVNATSITVKAVDGFSQTYTITAGTRIRERTPGKGTGVAGTVSDLKSGDKVGVLGKAPEKSSAQPMATVVVERLAK